ncbi:MAG: hypothetical protein J07HB67_02031 [halophilic archaeon J07HB67]|nr:MAG: hypothetical protein J07HB67_02031 [halophilic archaeon J07HB67]
MTDGSASDSAEFQWVTDPVPRGATGDEPPSGGDSTGVDTDESVELTETSESTESRAVRVGLDGVASEPLGGWAAVPDDPPEQSTDSQAADVSLPTPPLVWRDGDPTGAAWWTVLFRATQLSVVVSLLWSVAVVTLAPTVLSASETVSTWATLGVGGLTVVTGVVRFVVVPVALYRDATLVGRTDAVAWTPRRRELVAAVGVAATPTCLYYLYLRGRHVGNPRVPLGPSVLRYEGQRVASNWWLAAGVAVVAGTAAGGVATGLSGLSTPAAVTRTALGGPFLTLAGAEAFVATTTTLPRPVDVAVGAPALALGGVAAFLRLVVLPIALYADATAVRRSAAPWEPLALWYAAAGWVLAVPTGLVYLARRRAWTGVSFSGDDGP